LTEHDPIYVSVYKQFFVNMADTFIYVWCGPLYDANCNCVIGTYDILNIYKLLNFCNLHVSQKHPTFC